MFGVDAGIFDFMILNNFQRQFRSRDIVQWQLPETVNLVNGISDFFRAEHSGSFVMFDILLGSDVLKCRRNHERYSGETLDQAEGSGGQKVRWQIFRQFH